jgi:hypothetical protein
MPRYLPNATMFMNPKRELAYARSSLRYWQRELHCRRTARRPNAGVIKQAEQRVLTALERVGFWQAALTSRERRRAQQLDFWRAFVVPTEFAGAAQ